MISGMNMLQVQSLLAAATAAANALQNNPGKRKVSCNCILRAFQPCTCNLMDPSNKYEKRDPKIKLVLNGNQAIL